MKYTLLISALSLSLAFGQAPQQPNDFAGVVRKNKAPVSNDVLRVKFAKPVEGKLKNISPVRPMSFYITVETDAGTYAAWHIPELNCNKTTILKRQICNRLMQNARGGVSRTFNVRVRSAIPSSEEGRRWSSGEFPVPVFGR